MTDIEALRARMREAAEKATPGPWTRRDTPDYAEMIGEDESRPLALVGKPEDADFIALASPANVKALDAYTTRLREDLDRVTRERDGAYLTSQQAAQSYSNLMRVKEDIDARRQDAEAALAVVTRERDEALTAVASGAYNAALKEHQNVYTHTVALCVERMRDAQARAEAAEAALAKRDEEVARLRDKVEGLSADLTEAVRIAYKYGAATWVQMNYPKQHATLTKEPTNAE